jgi:hypothetical protein
VTTTAIEGAQFSLGVYAFGGGNAVLTDVVATASATNNVVAGLYNDDVTANLTNFTAATSGGGSRYGIINGISVATTVTVDRSTLAGTTASILNQAAGSVARVAGSKLVGPVNNVPSTLAASSLQRLCGAQCDVPVGSDWWFWLRGRRSRSPGRPGLPGRLISLRRKSSAGTAAARSSRRLTTSPRSR